jgi:hypothetical protein
LFKTRITDIINAVRDSWEETPDEINNGLCDYFATAILERFPKAREECSEFYEAPVGHVWVSYEGRHYDAQAPEGVDRWSDLPIFLLNSAFPKSTDRDEAVCSAPSGGDSGKVPGKLSPSLT